MLENHSLIKATAVAFLGCLVLASQAISASFEIRRVHPNNDAIVASKMPDIDLSQYEKWTWKWDKHTEDMWVSKQVDINIKDCTVAQSRVPPSPLPPYPALPMVDIVLTDVGEKKLAALSTQHMKKRIALILENKLLSVPIIIERMPDGRMSFSVDDTLAEAQKIASRINELIGEDRAHRY